MPADPLASYRKMLDNPLAGTAGVPGATAPPKSSGAPATEPISGDSLTQILRSLTNMLGLSGEGAFNFGGQLLGGGGDMLKAGGEVFGKGVESFKAPQEYWSKILAGDPQSMTEALAPEANALSDQYAAAARSAETSGPRGGARAATLANLPFAKARDIGDLYQKLRPQAATQLQSIAQVLSQLGIGQEQVGEGEQQIGISEQQTGLDAIIKALQGLLERRGQNMGPGSFAGQFGAISQGLANLI